MGSSPRQHPHGNSSSSSSSSRSSGCWWHVLLWAPNLIGYFRIALFVATSSLVSPQQQPWGFSLLLALNFLMDAVDGSVARSLHQVSAFGALLDVVIDNMLRTFLWFHALPNSLLPLFVSSLEWTVMAATHKRGGAAWKEGCFVNAPLWVTLVMRNGFKTPLGCVVILGIDFLPLWMLMRQLHPSMVTSSRFVGAILIFGRGYGAFVEVWLLVRHVKAIVEEDLHG